MGSRKRARVKQGKPDFVLIGREKFIQSFLEKNPNTSREEIEEDLKRALDYYKAGETCRCGNPIWVRGSAMVQWLACFTCITGEAWPDGEFEIDLEERHTEMKERHTEMKRIVLMMDGPEVYGCELMATEKIVEEQERVEAHTGGTVQVVDACNPAEALYTKDMRKLLTKLGAVIADSESEGHEYIAIKTKSAFSVHVHNLLRMITELEQGMEGAEGVLLGIVAPTRSEEDGEKPDVQEGEPDPFEKIPKSFRNPTPPQKSLCEEIAEERSKFSHRNGGMQLPVPCFTSLTAVEMLMQKLFEIGVLDSGQVDDIVDRMVLEPR